MNASSRASNTPPLGTVQPELATPVPPSLLVPPPRSARPVAKALAIGFALFGLAAMLAPWRQTVRGAGQVVAYAPEARQQAIEATISGRVLRWHVQDGSQVRKGEPVVELTDNDPGRMDRLEAERNAMELRKLAHEQRVDTLRERIESLKRAQQAQVGAAEAEVGIATEQVRAAEQDLAVARAELDTAEIQLSRQRSLEEQGLASARELELAEMAARQARARLSAAEADVRAARSQLAARRATLERTRATVQADLDGAWAGLRDAETDVASTRESLARLDVDLARQRAQAVVAPTDGTILRVLVQPGAEQVSQGDPLAILVPDTTDRAVALYVDGNDAVLMRPGSLVRLQFEGWPAIQFSGWPSAAVGTFGGMVAFVDPADDGRGDFRVMVVPDPKDTAWPEPPYLRQGTRAKGWFLLDRVRLGYELWRQFNGFPPTVPAPKAQNGAEEAG